MTERRWEWAVVWAVLRCSKSIMLFRLLESTATWGGRGGSKRLCNHKATSMHPQIGSSLLAADCCKQRHCRQPPHPHTPLAGHATTMDEDLHTVCNSNGPRILCSTFKHWQQQRKNVINIS